MSNREVNMSGMAGVRAGLYNTLMRRNSVYVTACVVASYFVTHSYFSGTDSLWKSINRGVRLFATNPHHPSAVWVSPAFLSAVG